jgi:hypothetical protein
MHMLKHSMWRRILKIFGNKTPLEYVLSIWAARDVAMGFPSLHSMQLWSFLFLFDWVAYTCRLIGGTASVRTSGRPYLQSASTPFHAHDVGPAHRRHLSAASSRGWPLLQGVVCLSPLTTMESRNTVGNLIHINQMEIHYIRSIYF